MKTLIAAALVAAVLTVAATGCGGGGGSPSVHYSASRVTDCLSFRVDDRDDLVSTEAEAEAVSHTLGADGVAESAGEGWLEAGFDGSPQTGWKNEVQMFFERTEDDAKRSLKDENLLAGDNAAEVTRMGNAVITWSKTPTAEERAAVADCLKISMTEEGK